MLSLTLRQSHKISLKQIKMSFKWKFANIETFSLKISDSKGTDGRNQSKETFFFYPFRTVAATFQIIN